MHYYPHHIGDYERDTAALTLLEHGVYGKLMRSYYATERPLPPDHASLFRICGALNKAEREAVITITQRFFIPGQDGQLYHKRIEEEIANYRALVKNAALGGKASAEARKRRIAASATAVGTPVAPPFNRGSTAVQPPLPPELPPAFNDSSNRTPTTQHPGTMNHGNCDTYTPAATGTPPAISAETDPPQAQEAPPPPAPDPDPSRGIPDSEVQARSMASTIGVDPAYAATVWREHDGTTWEDSQGRPINNFSSYVKARFNHRKEKLAREAAARKRPPYRSRPSPTSPPPGTTRPSGDF